MARGCARPLVGAHEHMRGRLKERRQRGATEGGVEVHRLILRVACDVPRLQACVGSDRFAVGSRRIRIRRMIELLNPCVPQSE